MDVDPITLEVMRNKLDGIANEMQLTLVRSAFSAIVKEGLDASASLFTLQGETLAQALAIPIHLGALTPMVGRLLQTVPADQMGEGDIWILNDTYLGGTHLPDIAIMMPVFADGRVIAISAAMTHHQDVGGMAPGSTPTNATEIFQEGIRIPLLQFRKGDALNATLIAMLRQNVRLPDVLMGDINAQVAACTIGARRLGELAESFGRKDLVALFDELLNRSETMTRQALRHLQPGIYRHVDYLDNDGIELDTLVRIEVAVTIGTFHLASGYAIAFVNQERAGNYLDAFLDRLPTIVLYSFLIPFGFAVAGTALNFGVLFTSTAPTPIFNNLLGLDIPIATTARVSLPVIVGTLFFLVAGHPIREYLSSRTSRSAVRGLGDGLLEAVAKPFEFFLNTISYIRLGVLLITTTLLGSLVAGVLSYGAAGVVVAALLNVAVISLEGVIVYIQDMRLQLYEWLSQFYAGTGTPFVPLVSGGSHFRANWAVTDAPASPLQETPLRHVDRRLGA